MLTHLRRCFQTVTSSARQYGISKQIVLHRLRQAGQPIRPRRLTARHRAARLQWAQWHFLWGRQQWAWVLFSDESSFNLSYHEGGIQVFRRRGKHFADNCLIEGDRFGAGSVMVWGALWAEGKQISCLCKATSLFKVTLTRFCCLKLFLSFKGMGLQY